MTINTEDDLKLEISKNMKNVLNNYFTSVEVSAYQDSLIASVVLEDLRTWLKERSGAFAASKQFNDAIDAAVDFTDEQAKMNKFWFKEENKKIR